MAVTRKPATLKVQPDVDALILKGGSVASQRRHDKPASVVLRIPPDLLERVDAALAARPLKVPRHQWLLEAVIEKLERV